MLLLVDVELEKNIFILYSGKFAREVQSIVLVRFLLFFSGFMVNLILENFAQHCYITYK